MIIEDEPDKKKKDKTLKRVQKEAPNLATLQVREKQAEIRLLLFTVSPKFDVSS